MLRWPKRQAAVERISTRCESLPHILHRTSPKGQHQRPSLARQRQQTSEYATDQLGIEPAMIDVYSDKQTGTNTDCDSHDEVIEAVENGVSPPRCHALAVGLGFCRRRGSNRRDERCRTPRPQYGDRPHPKNLDFTIHELLHRTKARSAVAVSNCDNGPYVAEHIAA